jgi:hypothetical protein
MRKYKDVVNERYGITIKTVCPNCQETLLIHDREFKRILFEPVEKLSNCIVFDENRNIIHEPKPYIGSSDYTKDEYEYTCCNCGEVHRITYQEFSQNIVNYLGNNHIVFELTDDESKKVREFKEQYRSKLGDKWFHRKVDAMGMEYEYRILPGGLGHLVYVKNTSTGDEICVTDTKNW